MSENPRVSPLRVNKNLVNFEKSFFYSNEGQLWDFFIFSRLSVTLRAETIAGRNFRVFRVFRRQQNAKVFSQEIIQNLKNAKVFSRDKIFFFQANLRPLPENRCYEKINDTLVRIATIFFFFQSIHLIQLPLSLSFFLPW